VGFVKIQSGFAEKVAEKDEVSEIERTEEP
jgi:hypothetical protein